MENFVDFSIDNNFNVIMSSSHHDRLTTKHITIDDLIHLLEAVKSNSTYTPPIEKVEDIELIYTSPIYNSRGDIHIISHSIFENNKETYLLKRGKSTKDVMYYDKNMTINLPELIFRVDIKENLIRSVYIYASETNLIKEDTDLYIPNLPNVYNDGRVCLGTNSLLSKAVIDPMELLSVPDMVLEMPFTHALLDGDARDSLKRLVDSEMDFGKLNRKTNITKIIKGDDKFEF